MIIINDKEVEGAILTLMGDNPAIYSTDEDEHGSVYEDFQDIPIEERLKLLTLLGIEALIQDMLISIHSFKFAAQLDKKRALQEDEGQVARIVRYYVNSISPQCGQTKEEYALVERWMKDVTGPAFKRAKEIIEENEKDRADREKSDG